MLYDLFSYKFGLNILTERFLHTKQINLSRSAVRSNEF